MSGPHRNDPPSVVTGRPHQHDKAAVQPSGRNVSQLAAVGAPIVGRCEVVARKHLGGLGEIEPASGKGGNPLRFIRSQAHITVSTENPPGQNYSVSVAHDVSVSATDEPASSVRGPSHSVKRGKTPVLDPSEARAFLDGMDVAKPVGLRDRALIGLMVYSFARIGAALAMKVEDVSVQNRRLWVRLHEKGGKRHEMRCCRLRDDPPARGFGRHRHKIGNHTFRTTGITADLENGGTLEKAAAMAGPRLDGHDADLRSPAQRRELR